MGKKAKYQIRDFDELVEVDAVEFEVFGYGTLIVHRDHRYPNKWTVSEPRSGFFIAHLHKTKKEAMVAAVNDTVQGTPEQWQGRIVTGLVKARRFPGPVTRYEQENYE